MFEMFLNDHNFMLLPFALMFIAVATACFLKMCVTIKDRTAKFTYYGLFCMSVTTLGVYAGHSPGYYSSKCLLFLFSLFTFSLVCAIIQIKLHLNRSWSQIGETSVRNLIYLIGRRRKRLERMRDETRGEQAENFLKLIAVTISALAFSYFIPWTSFFIALFWWDFFVEHVLYKCLESCTALVAFWFLYSLLSAIFLSLFIMEIMKIGDGNMAILYGLLCISLSYFWCSSAGVVDYDVAKMAGSIINTATTILLLGINITFGWIQRDFGGDPDDIIFMLNLAIFPLVAAGYLAVLYADALNYTRIKLEKE